MKKILIVEDEPALLRVLSDKFTNEGFSVLEAKNGLTGLKMALEEKPEVVLLDILMPELDGMEMMRRLREANTYGKSVPIVILTNLDADEKITWAVAKDEPAYYLIKSNVDMDEIVEKVNQAVEQKQVVA
ncbi:MAG: response regulator [Microgenomates group bacterium]